MQRIDAGEILQKLYDSEINFVINTFWDEGFYFYLEDDINGCASCLTSDNHSFVDGVILLAEEAIRKYPESEFTRWWRKKNDV